jgi:hypothetical protein
MIKQYDLMPCDGDSGRCRADLEQSDDGDWVKHEDYATLKAERDALQVLNQQLIMFVYNIAQEVSSYFSSTCIGDTKISNHIKQVQAIMKDALRRELITRAQLNTIYDAAQRERVKS